MRSVAGVHVRDALEAIATRHPDLIERFGGHAMAAGLTLRAGMLARFADHVRSFVDVGALRPLKVVADTANGMGGLVVPAVFDPLPFELEVLYPELDGTFPNHPADPIQPENQRDLQDRVLATGASGNAS